ncbi:biotin/lipoyl-containing protein [Arthrobacter sp. GMC3]|uniref:biotin/lipoyl-containing protein n=1 Tax=Arthrobacter sp. GMC3 TaxID=2058894 RepID=UPI000CE5645C|nr:biotin/lipoyl-containing protein [Arthrobacter sp. GMC3]
MVEVLFPMMTGDPEDHGVLTLWLVPDGDTVHPYQVLAEVAIDKFDAEINAPSAGTLKWRVQEGDEVSQGAVIATIE